MFSPFNVAVYAGNSRRRVGGWLLPNSLTTISQKDIEYWCGLACRNDWLMVEIGEIPLDIVLKVCKRFSAADVRIAVDVDLDPVTQCGGGRDVIGAIFSLADLLIPNCKSMGSVYGNCSTMDLAQAMYKD